MLNVFQKYKYELILAILIVGFTIFQWDALHLPYFWDELAYYARAALYQHDHNISLLPNSLPPELSRGHPLLFSALQGAWFSLLGTSLFAGHLFPFLLSISTVWILFIFLKKLMRSSFLALMGSTTLLVQPLFVAQSALILPEVALTLFSICTVFFYFKEKWWLSILFGCAAVLTKETGFIIPLTILLLDIFNHGNMVRSLKFASPLIVLAVFFIIQRIQQGWFFFPFHVELISFSLMNFIQEVVKSCYFFFVAQGRLLLTILFVYGIATFRKHPKNVQHLIILSLFVILIGVFTMSFLHLMNRYLLFLMPFYIVVIIVGASEAIVSSKYFSVFIPVALLPVFFFLKSAEFNMAADLGYRDAIRATSKVYELCITENRYEQHGFCHESLIAAFGDDRLGYNSAKKSFNLSETQHLQVEYAIEINPDGWNRDISYWKGFKEKKRIREGNFEVIILVKR